MFNKELNIIQHSVNGVKLFVCNIRNSTNFCFENGNQQGSHQLDFRSPFLTKQYM